MVARVGWLVVAPTALSCAQDPADGELLDLGDTADQSAESFDVYLMDAWVNHDGTSGPTWDSLSPPDMRIELAVRNECGGIIGIGRSTSSVDSHDESFDEELLSDIAFAPNQVAFDALVWDEDNPKLGDDDDPMAFCSLGNLPLGEQLIECGDVSLNLDVRPADDNRATLTPPDSDWLSDVEEAFGRDYDVAVPCQ